jgi:hypothetical protein
MSESTPLSRDCMDRGDIHTATGVSWANRYKNGNSGMPTKTAVDERVLALYFAAAIALTEGVYS